MRYSRLCTRLAAAALTLALVWSAAAEASDPYRLGAQDKLRIKVIEWRASRGEVYDWKNLTGDFTVSASGSVFLPLLGEVAAANLTPAELASSISERLQAKVGLAERPDTSVEIVQFRPFYIVGNVERPGEYPFRPGINVLQAMSIAGGLYRLSDTTLLRFEREAIASRGDLRLLGTERSALLARRARLQAEVDNRQTITFPDELLQDKRPGAEQVMREEQLIFQSRRSQLQAQIDSLVQLKTLLEREVDALQSKSVSLDRQLGLARKELDNITALLSKGLTSTAHQLSLEQNAAQFESAKIDVDLSRLRTREDISKAERTIIDLQNQRRNDVLTELRQTQAKLAEVAEKTATAQNLTYDSEVISPRQLTDRPDEAPRPPILTILRRTGDGSETHSLTAEETDLVEPGDIIKVEKPAMREKSAGLPAPPDDPARFQVGSRGNQLLQGSNDQK